MTQRPLIGFALLAACLLCFSGCDQKSDSDSGTEQSQAKQEKPANVNLPPVPSLDLLDIPEEYSDGNNSVIGLLDNQDKYIGKPIKVKALLDEIYVCTPSEKEGEDKESNDKKTEGKYNQAGCKHPHLYIADTKESPRRLLVTGYDYRHYEEQLQEGLQYVFTGSYREAAAGFSSSDGLLVIDKIEGNSVTQLGEENVEKEE